jgi:hypothetical protein
MNNLPSLPLSARKRLFEEAEAATGIPDYMAEKDFWVCWTLNWPRWGTSKPG